MKTESEFLQFLTDNGVKRPVVGFSKADGKYPDRLCGTGLSSNPGVTAQRLNRAMEKLGVKGRVNRMGRGIWALLFLGEAPAPATGPKPEREHTHKRLPDGSFDIPTHVSDGGGPTDIRRQMESRSNALVERLLNETPMPPAAPAKLGRNVIAIEPKGDEIMAVDADESVLNQLRQEGFEVDEFDVTFGVLPKSQARYDALVDSGRTFRLVTPSGLVVKTVDFM